MSDETRACECPWDDHFGTETRGDSPRHPYFARFPAPEVQPVQVSAGGPPVAKCAHCRRAHTIEAVISRVQDRARKEVL